MQSNKEISKINITGFKPYSKNFPDPLNKLIMDYASPTDVQDWTRHSQDKKNFDMLCSFQGYAANFNFDGFWLMQIEELEGLLGIVKSNQFTQDFYLNLVKNNRQAMYAKLLGINNKTEDEEIKKICVHYSYNYSYHSGSNPYFQSFIESSTINSEKKFHLIRWLLIALESHAPGVSSYITSASIPALLSAALHTDTIIIKFIAEKIPNSIYITLFNLLSASLHCNDGYTFGDDTRRYSDKEIATALDKLIDGLNNINTSNPIPYLKTQIELAFKSNIPNTKTIEDCFWLYLKMLKFSALAQPDHKGGFKGLFQRRDAYPEAKIKCLEELQRKLLSILYAHKETPRNLLPVYEQLRGHEIFSTEHNKRGVNVKYREEFMQSFKSLKKHMGNTSASWFR